MRLNKAFEPFLTYLRASGRCDGTINKHKRVIDESLSRIAGRRVSSLHLADCATICEAARTHGKYGQQQAIVTFRCLLRYLRESGVRVPVDWRDIKVPRVPNRAPDFLDDKEIEKVRSAVATSTVSGMRTRALVELLLDTGLRISEAIALNRKDVDWDKLEVPVVNSKTGEAGSVFLTKRSAEWLLLYLQRRRDGLPALFVSGRGRLLAVTARASMAKVNAVAGIAKRVNHHIFRRTLATRLIQNGVDIKTTQTILRHRSERTTLRYYVAADRDRAKREHRRVMGINTGRPLTRALARIMIGWTPYAKRSETGHQERPADQDTAPKKQALIQRDF